MSNGDESVCKIIRSYLDDKKIDYFENEEQDATNFKASSFGKKANIKVFKSGKLLVQGVASKLKEKLEELKDRIENGEISSDQFLDSDSMLENFPEQLKTVVPFIKEAVDCFNGGKVLAAFHLLALASEKTIHEYAKSKNWMLSNIYGLMVPGYQNLRKKREKGQQHIMTKEEQLIDDIIHYYRTARSEYGHPKNVKELESYEIKQFIHNVKKLLLSSNSN